MQARAADAGGGVQTYLLYQDSGLHLPGLKGPMRPDVFCACSLFHEEGRILQVLASHLPGPSRLQLRVWFSVVGRHREASSCLWLPSTRREDSHRGPPHGTRHKPCWLHPAPQGLVQRRPMTLVHSRIYSFHKCLRTTSCVSARPQVLGHGCEETGLPCININTNIW